jgi:hypothetical protein
VSIRMTARQAAKLMGERARPKYGARITEYNGVKYHSNREAQYAAELDLLIRAGKVQYWVRQMDFVLHVEGIAIGKHVVDFRIADEHGQVRYVEIKGVDTALGRWKRKHAEAEYGIEIEVVK